MLKKNYTFIWTVLIVFFVEALFPLNIWRVAWSKTMTREAGHIAIVGFRAEEFPFEKSLQVELANKFGNLKTVSLVPEVVSNQVISEIWSQEAKDAKQKVKEARRHFMEGKRLYDQLALDEAIRSFNRSVIAYREGIGALKDNRYLLISHLYLGMALIVLGKEDEGRKYIQEMVILDASRNKRTLSQKEFPPKILEAHKSLTQEIANGPSGLMSVSVQPLTSTLYVNGLIQKEQAPGQYEVPLPVGEHFIVVEKKGYRQVAKRVTMNKGLNAMDINLEKWRPLSTYSFERRNNLIALESLNKIASELSAQILVLGSVIKNEEGQDFVLSGQLFDARSQEFSKIQTVETSANRAGRSGKVLARKLASQLTTQGLVIADIRMSSTKISSTPTKITDPIILDEPMPVKTRRSFSSPEKMSKPIYKRTWFWAVIGLAAAGGGAAFFLQPEDDTFNVLKISPTP